MIMVYSVTKDEEGVYFIEYSNWGGKGNNDKTNSGPNRWRSTER